MSCDKPFLLFQREKEKIRLMEKSTHSGLATRPIEGTAPQPAKSPNRDSGYGKDVKGSCLEIKMFLIS